MAYRILRLRSGELEVINLDEWPSGSMSPFCENEWLLSTHYATEEEARADVQRFYAWVGQLTIKRLASPIKFELIKFKASLSAIDKMKTDPAAFEEMLV